MRTALLVVLYLAAIVTANLLVNHFGPSATPYVAFGLIGADLTIRDLLQVNWQRRQLWLRMAALIIAGGLLTYLVNTGAQKIVLASVTAFVAAGVVDTLIYSILRSRPLETRVNVSNVFSSAVDSLLFPTIAFSGVLWSVSFNQWVAKIAGGVVWLLVLKHLHGKEYYTLVFKRGDRVETVVDAELISVTAAVNPN